SDAADFRPGVQASGSDKNECRSPEIELQRFLGPFREVYVGLTPNTTTLGTDLPSRVTGRYENAVPFDSATYAAPAGAMRTISGREPHIRAQADVGDDETRQEFRKRVLAFAAFRPLNDLGIVHPTKRRAVCCSRRGGRGERPFLNGTM